MKKLYSTFTVLCLCSFAMNAQKNDSEYGVTVSAQEKTEILKQVRSRQIDTREAMGGSCDSLLIDTAAGNNFDGNMFDVNIYNTITIETFGVTVDPGAWNVAIFHKTGTFVGSETTAGNWTFLDSAIVSGAGPSIPVKVPVNLGLVLNGSTMHAFYVTVTNTTPSFYYTNGTAVGTIQASDANLEVLEGNGGGYPFNVTFSPRVFNGQVHYCLGAVGIDESSVQTTVTVYPNPANDLITLNMESYVGKDVALTMYNALGELVYTEQINSALNSKTIDVSSLTEGVYMAETISGGHTSITRFVVAK
ncbi:MAG: T9SS type A sorting domain-containing protein [Flavobacteriales bacterium]